MLKRISWRHFIYFLVAALIASVFFSFFLRDTFRRYEAEARVAVIARTAAAAPARDLAANLVSFSQTDEYRRLFFDRLLERRGMSGGELSVRFDTMVAVRQHPSGSMLSIRGYSDDPEMAREIAREAALSLFVFAGQYYNVKHEADFRIVGMMPGRYGIEGPIPYVVSSVSFGFGVVAIGYLIVFGIPARRVPGRKRFVRTLDRAIFTPKRPVTESYFHHTEPDKTAAAPEKEDQTEAGREEDEMEPSELESLLRPVQIEERKGGATVADEASRVEDEENREYEPEKTKYPPVTPEKKGSAPSNLPGGMADAEDRFLNEFSFEDEPSQIDSSGTKEEVPEVSEIEEAPDEAPAKVSESKDEWRTEETKDPDAGHEPTEEEYRRRLNELLKG